MLNSTFENLALLKDPKFYLENLVKIKGKKPGQLIPFILKEHQKDLFNTIKNYSRIMILKARQLGTSTAIVGYFYHQTIMNPGTTTAIIGYNTQLTAELLDKIKTFYRSTPNELKPTIHYDSKWEVSFPRIDSKILVLPSTENVGRGYTLQNCHVTELQSWENQEEKMITLEAAVPINGKLIVEGTPLGVGNYFHRLWMGDNDYVKKEYGWWHGYSEKEIEIIKRRLNNPMKFAQEYGLEFLSSGLAVFDIRKLIEHRKNILKIGDTVKDGDQVYKVEEVDGWRIYKKLKPDHFYVVGADVAEGLEGGDFSVGIIWDRTTGEEVAFYRRYIPADIFGKKLNEMGRIYNNALMVVEINNHGLTTITTLKNLLYPSFYFRPDKIETMGQGTSDRLGWKTNRVTRPILIDDFDKAFRENVLTIHSKELLDEMTVFVYDKNGDMNPQSGFNDDCLKKGTLIKTIDGYKEIEKIVSGELVLTHLGRYRKVEKCLEKPFSNIWYNLDINGQLNLELSYNHPIYCATGVYKKVDGYKRINRGHGTSISELINYNKRQWKLPNELLKSYKPISIIENFDSCSNRIIEGVDNKWGFGKKNIKIIFNKDFSKFLGLFLAEGHALKNCNQMSLAFHERDVGLLNEMRFYLEGLGIHVQEKHREETHCRVLYFVSKTLHKIMNDCYDENGEKKLPYYSKELGNNLIYTLEYWLKGDGWDNGYGIYNIIGATTSKKLALGMRDIAWSAGYYAVIHQTKRHRYEINNKDQYYVSIKYTKNKIQHLQQLSNFEYGGKIHNIEKTFFNGTVYNLQVEDDRSFIADGVVVHNCIFAGAIGCQGFKILSSTKLEQLDYSKFLPHGYAY